MKIAYLDLSYGITARMLLGAQLDGGLSLDALRESLAPMDWPRLEISARETRKAGLRAIKVDLRVDPSPPKAASLDGAIGLIKKTEIPERTQQQLECLLRRLAEAESRTRGIPHSGVGFDNTTVVQAAAVLAGFHILQVDRVLVSPVRVGSLFGMEEAGSSIAGRVVTELLVGFHLVGGPVETPLVNPLGAALLKELAESCASIPSMDLTSVGVGAGDLDLDPHPHILRLLLGTLPGETADEVVVIESQIDDMTPEGYGSLMEDAFRAGALDVLFTPVYMKKNRPGTLVTVLAPPGREEDLIRLVLRESTTLGVRYRRVQRRVLHREQAIVETAWGPIRGKVVWGAGVERRFKPEYEDCRRIHQQTGLPFMQIARTAFRAYEDKCKRESETDSREGVCPSSET